MCRLLETIRYSRGKICNPDLHEARMNYSRRELFGINEPIKLSDHIPYNYQSEEGVTRCRVIYRESIISVEFTPYIPATIRTLKLVEADDLVYDHKYLDRGKLNGLIDKSTADDILIVKNGCITDASFANIAFSDSREWFTPDTPLLRGTMRSLLLDQGIIKETRVTPGELGRYTHFRLINAMLCFDAPILPVGGILT